MSLTYDSNTPFHVLCGIQDDYTAWFMQVNNALFYPENNKNNQSPAIPDSFLEWADDVQDCPAALAKAHSDLVSKAQATLDEAKKAKKPPVPDQYQELCAALKTFLDQLSDLEKSIISDGDVLDTITGLRPEKSLEADLLRELDRLERRGLPFSLALMKINDFDRLQKIGEKEARQALKKVSDLMKRNLRSYDDAYYLGDGRFGITLKQTQRGNASGVLSRIVQQFKAVITVLHPEEPTLYLRSCVGEPFPGEKIKTFMETLEQDLETYKSEEGSVLEHRELSELEKLIHKRQSI